MSSSSQVPSSVSNSSAAEVPDAVKRLIRLVMKTFYGPESSLAVDMLMRRGLMREEELGDLLGFERKQLRLIFAKLKSDLLVKTRIKVEMLQNPNGTQRSNRHNYFFLNYRAFVNVVKYKLDHVRRRLETEERDSINRAFFQCNRCKKTFNELDVGNLYSPDNGHLLCDHCGADVIEVEAFTGREEAPSSSGGSKRKLARFHEQLAPIFEQLRECDDIVLPASLSEPDLAIEGLTDPDAIEAPSGRAAQAASSASLSSAASAASESSSAGRARANDSTRILLDIGGGDRSGAANAVNPKERPVWLAESTLAPTLGASVGAAGDESGSEPDSKRARKSEIMQLILAHELLPKGSKAHARAVAGAQQRAPAAATLHSADVSDIADFSRYTNAVSTLGNSPTNMGYSEVNRHREEAAATSAIGMDLGDAMSTSVEHFESGLGVGFAELGLEMSGAADESVVSSASQPSAASSAYSYSYSSSTPAAAALPPAGRVGPGAPPPSAPSAAVQQQPLSTAAADAPAVVHVGGRTVPFDEVTSDLLERMTDTERAEYTAVGQRLYQMLE